MSSPLKIGFLWPWLLVGGSELWVLGLVRNADPRRLQFSGLALPEWGVEDPVMVEYMTRYLPVYAGPPKPGRGTDPRVLRPGPDASYGIAAACRDADVIIASCVPLLPVMTASYLEMGKKVVLVSHCEGPEDSMRLLERGATHYTAVCQVATRPYTAPRRPSVRVLYNGVEPGRCVPRAGRLATRQRLGLSDRDIVVSFFGRCSWEKNPLAAAQAVQRLGPSFKALYLETGIALDAVRAEAEKIAPGQVLFVPTEPQLGDLLAATDVLMAASHTEALSLLLLEAWMAGVPTVATPVGAMPELSERFGQLSVVVPYNATVEELADGAAQALSRSNRPVIDHARWVAWEHFNAGACADRWAGYLEEVCGRAG